MECREIKKSIPGFFSDELEGKELTEFIAHISQCEECEEEVTIQYLATEGIVRLEKGQTFELDKELDTMIKKRLEGAKLKRRIHFVLGIVEIVSILAIIAVFAYVLF